MKKAQRYQDIDDKTEELRDITEDHPDLWKEFLSQFELSWIYHDNALEGIVVTHAEMTSALRGKPIAPDTYYSIRNQKLGINLIRKLAAQRTAPIDLEMVQLVHSALGEGTSNFEAGEYRKIIPLHRTYFHEIGQPQDIEPRMNALMEWARENVPDDDDAVRYAAHFHHEFMSIFPFPKHTGKVGRLLVNFLLLRHGYMPVVFHASERQRYYDTLRHNPKKTEAFLIDMMGNCIDNAEKYIRAALAERDKRRTTGGLYAVG